MATKTVTYKARQTGGNAQTVSLQVKNWKQQIAALGDYVEFKNIGNGVTFLDLTIVIGTNGPFTQNHDVILPQNSSITREVAKTGTYKYIVRAGFGDDEIFEFDPRFIIN